MLVYYVHLLDTSYSFPKIPQTLHFQPPEARFAAIADKEHWPVWIEGVDLSTTIHAYDLEQLCSILNYLKCLPHIKVIVESSHTLSDYSLTFERHGSVSP